MSGNRQQHMGAATVEAAWARLGPRLRQAGVRRVALVGVAPPAGYALRDAADRHGVNCVVVDGMRHHTPRQAKSVASRSDVVVLCVSGPIAHRVSGQYRSRSLEASVVAVHARGADGITRELEGWLTRTLAVPGALMAA